MPTGPNSSSTAADRAHTSPAAGRAARGTPEPYARRTTAAAWTHTPASFPVSDTAVSQADGEA